jgi:hypothetical protein
MMEEEGCICTGKSIGRLRVSKEAVNGICVVFQCSPRKSTRWASREHLLLALKEDKVKRFNCCCGIQNRIENDDDILTHLMFSDKSVFHLSKKVNRHNVRIWGTEASHVDIEHERDSPKVNVFCATSCRWVCGPFLFCREYSDRDHISGHAIRVTLPSATRRLWRIHFAAEWASASLPRLGPEVPQWTSTTVLDRTFCPKHWPACWGVVTQIPRHHNMWFFLWGSIKHHVFLPPLPRNLQELTERMAALSTINADVIQKVWDELDYRIDLCHVTKGHILNIWGLRKNCARSLTNKLRLCVKKTLRVTSHISLDCMFLSCLVTEW